MDKTRLADCWEMTSLHRFLHTVCLCASGGVEWGRGGASCLTPSVWVSVESQEESVCGCTMWRACSCNHPEQ